MRALRSNEKRSGNMQKGGAIARMNRATLYPTTILCTGRGWGRIAAAGAARQAGKVHYYLRLTSFIQDSPPSSGSSTTATIAIPSGIASTRVTVSAGLLVLLRTPTSTR